MTSRMLPRIEPTSDALTTSCRPSRSAKKAMIELGRVAERDVEQAADARARSAPRAPRSRGP